MTLKPPPKEAIWTIWCGLVWW